MDPFPGYQQHPGYPEGQAGGVNAPLANNVPVTSAAQMPPFPTAAFIAPAQPAARIFPGAPQPSAPFMAPPNPQMINFVQPPAAQFPAAFPPFQTFPAVVSFLCTSPPLLNIIGIKKKMKTFNIIDIKKILPLKIINGAILKMLLFNNVLSKAKRS